MSFSSQIKDELSRQAGAARHCQIAELTAILTMCGGVRISADDRYTVLVHTENLYVARKFCILLHRIFRITGQVRVRTSKARRQGGCIYTVVVGSNEDALRILQASRLLRSELEIEEEMSLVDNTVVRQNCCRRAFLRGAFLASGSVSDPKKSYHFEIVALTQPKAEQLREMMVQFGLDARITPRKGHYVVYLKEGAQIVDMLGIMEAPKSLMEMENVRIVREIKNTVNRKVNCETANLGKTVSASLRQREDIEYLEETGYLEKLPTALQETARLRLENPDIPLSELGAMHQPPVGKSGVNHRLRKICNEADRIRRSAKRSGNC